MTAFASPLKNPTRRRTLGAIVPAAMPVEPKPSRVLSVSARWLEDGEAATSQSPPPRGLIEGDLQALTAVARREAARLQSSLKEAASRKIDSDDTIHRLDERLEIGAQMLQAFQHQIERIEYAVATAAAIEQRNQRLVETLRELLPALDAA